MCLLVSQPATSKFTDEFISGVYRLNSDGLGVMYAENNSLFIKRCVPNTEKEFFDFFKENIEGRDCAWHARMKTHGDIDMLNCHPYQVLSAEDGYPLYLAHNGILHTGNEADKKRSDTYHYIQDYLRPMLLKNPEFFLTDAFKDLVAAHIGHGNKFVLMDAYGNRVTVNQKQGVQHQGAWLSNTYAWETEGTEHEAKRYLDGYGGTGYGGRKSSYWDDDEFDTPLTKLAKYPVETPYDEVLDFCEELFDIIEKVGLKQDEITWDDAEAYYHACGRDQAWDIIEAITYGAYTQKELEDELTYYTKLSDKWDRPDLEEMLEEAEYDDSSTFVLELPEKIAA